MEMCWKYKITPDKNNDACMQTGENIPVSIYFQRPIISNEASFEQEKSEDRIFNIINVSQ